MLADTAYGRATHTSCGSAGSDSVSTGTGNQECHAVTSHLCPVLQVVDSPYCRFPIIAELVTTSRPLKAAM